jgi:hypothetical protein
MNKEDSTRYLIQSLVNGGFLDGRNKHMVKPEMFLKKLGSLLF